MMSPAKGKDLDNLALMLGFKRKRYFFIFKEWDKSLRRRLFNFVRGMYK